jgi:hypothetical protein
MTMLAPGVPFVEGKVAKGCHSLRGEDEMERQEKRWIGCRKERRMAWEERTWTVKVQRRRRSQGYIRRMVMRTRFQKVTSWISMVAMGSRDVDVQCAKSRFWTQKRATDIQPRKRWVISKVLWNLALMGGSERVRITSKSDSSNHAMIATARTDASLMNIRLVIAVNEIHHTVPATAAPL